VLIDHARAWRFDAPLAAAELVIDSAPSPEDAAIAGERWAEVSRLLHLLSPDQRHVVELRLAGLRSHEIGAVLGRSRGAVDAIQSRALARLRELLDPRLVATEGTHAAH
jgi:RNA polymerase sigma factor (sigma-70 family)